MPLAAVRVLPPAPAEIRLRADRLTRGAGPELLAWVAAQGRAEAQASTHDPARLKQAILTRFRGQIGGGDSRADAVALLVLLAAAGELSAKLSSPADAKDSLSEMGEMSALKLQMAMDRHSKLMSTLSNMLKKMSDANSSIIQNLK